MMTRTGDLSAAQKEEFDGWRGTLLKNELEMKMVNWDRNPPPQTEDQQTMHWPLMSTSAKAYGMIRRKPAGMEIAKGHQQGTAVEQLLLHYQDMNPIRLPKATAERGHNGG